MRRVLAAALLVTLLAPLLAGCGDSGDGGDGDSYINKLRGGAPEPSATLAPTETTEPTMTPVPIPTVLPTENPTVPTITPEIAAPVPTVPPPPPPQAPQPLQAPQATATAWVIYVTATPPPVVVQLASADVSAVEPCPIEFMRGKRCFATPEQLATAAAATK